MNKSALIGGAVLIGGVALLLVLRARAGGGTTVVQNDSAFPAYTPATPQFTVPTISIPGAESSGQNPSVPSPTSTAPPTNAHQHIHTPPSPRVRSVTDGAVPTHVAEAPAPHRVAHTDHIPLPRDTGHPPVDTPRTRRLPVSVPGHPSNPGVPVGSDYSVQGAPADDCPTCTTISARVKQFLM